MKDLEIWKIVKLDFNSTGLLVSSHGGIKNSSFVDRKVGDNGAGYKFASIQVLGERRSKKFYIHRLVAQQFLPKRSRIYSIVFYKNPTYSIVNHNS